MFVWGWGDFTHENVLKIVNECFLEGQNKIFEDYKKNGLTEEIENDYNQYQIKLLSEMVEQMPNEGMLAWDLVRILSIVGGAYIGGIMKYNEAAGIAFHAAKKLQETFSSWDHMIQSYNYGYKFWRNKNKKDRLIYYKLLKIFTWIYKIPWNTTLKENEL